MEPKFFSKKNLIKKVLLGKGAKTKSGREGWLEI